MPTIAMPASSAAASICSCPASGPSGLHGQRGRAGFRMTAMVSSPTTGTSNSRCPRPRATFTSAASSVHQARRAAQHGVGAFHGFDRDARALADRDALADIEAGQRVGDAAAVIDIALLILIGLALVSTPSAAQQRLQQQRGIAQLDAFVRQDLLTPPISASVFFDGSAASSLTSRQSGRMEEKIFACFTWPAIMTSVMPSACRSRSACSAAPSEIQWQRGAERLHFRRGLLLDRDRDHFMPESRARFRARGSGSGRSRR